MKLLLYCTKGKPYLYKDRGVEYALSNKKLVDNAFTKFNSLNGKIVAECEFEVEKIYSFEVDCFRFFDTDSLTFKELCKKSCLSDFDLIKYLDPVFYVYPKSCGYAIHIKNLNIYKSPRELFSYSCVKAPQNMQYVYTCYDKNEYVLISIQPQWLCKILNGEKTIEIRKKVLKRMIK